MKAVFCNWEEWFSGRRLPSLLYLFNAALAFIWGHSFASGVGWVLMALGFFAMSLNEASPGSRSKWQSPTYYAGFATTILGSGFLLAWTIPIVPKSMRPSTLAVVAVALLAFTAGRMLKRGEAGPK